MISITKHDFKKIENEYNSHESNILWNYFKKTDNILMYYKNDYIPLFLLTRVDLILYQRNNLFIINEVKYSPSNQSKYRFSRLEEIFLFNVIRFANFYYKKDNRNYNIILENGVVREDTGMPLLVLTVKYSDRFKLFDYWGHIKWDKVKFYLAKEFIDDKKYSRIYKKFDKEIIYKAIHSGAKLEILSKKQIQEELYSSKIKINDCFNFNRFNNKFNLSYEKKKKILTEWV